jgi:predicted N-acetyltransferase YhbS
MKFQRYPYTPALFEEVQDFLVNTHAAHPRNHNWSIDRLNFVCSVSQTFHSTRESWPDTVGLWRDPSGKMVALVNSEGETSGEAFIQLDDLPFETEHYQLFLDFAEAHLSVEKEEGRFLELRVDQRNLALLDLVRQQGYLRQDWDEVHLSLTTERDFLSSLPEGLTLVDGTGFTDGQKALAHRKVFGYFKDDPVQKETAERAFSRMRTMPAYRPDLDLAVMKHGEILSFATLWFDGVNRIALLEPVGTRPDFRRRGLGRAVIYQGILRAKALGAERIYVGSDQAFYHSIGFTEDHRFQIWRLENP